ncbi:alpha beta-hydrolase [Pyrenophora seminiperda CCB06]|uniref:Alpha beta-hydrolase n=1 Tax=Pyrenophora seminiperda CCB06 TaxID=1302712 RepID=A0A3M7MD18_9PLEO|nr:alpha beta-hydrolase [Pyrenophora seminiperda CCB06]
MFWGSFVSPVLRVKNSALYAHRFNTNFWHDVARPEEFGFAKGQVQPFWLKTLDNERLFCWHVLPLDVYLENEFELVSAATVGETVEGLKGTVGENLMSMDRESRVVVNFHGVSIISFFSGLSCISSRTGPDALLFMPSTNAGHIAQNQRPSTYRSITSIPKTHLLTCSYRGFSPSTLSQPPHIPTESGLITDAISLVAYLQTTLSHPASRTVLLGQSLGTAVTSAAALYFADPLSPALPAQVTEQQWVKQGKQGAEPFAAIILIAPFRNLALLLQTYKIGGFIPWIRGTRRLASVPSSPPPPPPQKNPAHFHIHILHARNDQDITFRESEALFEPLQTLMLGDESVSTEEERRSIHGSERVKRGAFAYKKVADARGERVLELEVVRYGGHNEVAGWSQASLAVRRAFERKSLRPGLDVE